MSDDFELTPEMRSILARANSHKSWANTPDRAARTAAARKAALGRFEKQVDPDGTMDPAERAQRAESAKKAFYQRMSYLSAVSRARKMFGNDQDKAVTEDEP